MDHSTIANIFLKIAGIVVDQFSKIRDRQIKLDKNETQRVADFLQRISTALSEAASAFEAGKIPQELCMELEVSVKAASEVVGRLSSRLSEDRTAMLMDLLKGGVNAPGVLSEILIEEQRRALLWYFQKPVPGEQPPSLETELRILREAAGAYRAAAELVKLGIAK